MIPVYHARTGRLVGRYHRPLPTDDPRQTRIRFLRRAPIIACWTDVPKKIEQLVASARVERRSDGVAVALFVDTAAEMHGVDGFILE